tara:strand:+ start:4122 stop:4850 length:729 start_codon:yes stop_codon:yes gene_type:complete
MIQATWSGGIDSTAVVGHLLKSGRDVRAISIEIYKDQQPLMWQRECNARSKLSPVMQAIAAESGATFEQVTVPGEWIWAFSPDGVEIPNRNRHIIDHLVAGHCIKLGDTDLAMGEYIGADSWVVQDHVDAMDADSRSLTSYLLLQWGLPYRLWTMADFGECRYKHNRVAMLIDAVGKEAALATTNCLYNCDPHCGKCYKCIERHVAFTMNDVEDTTDYKTKPSLERPQFDDYVAQMKEAHAH